MSAFSRLDLLICSQTHVFPSSVSTTPAPPTSLKGETQKGKERKKKHERNGRKESGERGEGERARDVDQMERDTHERKEVSYCGEASRSVNFGHCNSALEIPVDQPQSYCHALDIS